MKDREKIEMLINELLESGLSADKKEELIQLLRVSRENRDRYRKLLYVDTILSEKFREPSKKLIPFQKDGFKGKNKKWLVRYLPTVALAASLVFGMLVLFQREHHKELFEKKFTEILTSGWRLRAGEGAQYQVLNPYHIKLLSGEVYLESNKKHRQSLTVETLHARAEALGTRFYIGNYPYQQTKQILTMKTSKEKLGSSLTRVLVMSGLVTLSNMHGEITAQENDLVIAREGKKPFSAVQSGNTFAFNLYKEIVEEDKGENVFFSPLSVSSALAMLLEGARGETMREIGEVLCIPQEAQRIGEGVQYIPWETSQVHQGMRGLVKHLQQKSEGVKLSIANGFWVDQYFSLKQGFRNTLSTSYGVQFQPLNFAQEPELSRSKINQWVRKATREKIKEILPDGAIDRNTKAVLANAIYFYGEWEKAFDAHDTHNDRFYLSKEKKVRIKMMKQEKEFLYGSFDEVGEKVENTVSSESGFKLLALPYKGSGISMLVVLPNEVEGLVALEEKITTEKLIYCRGKMEKTKVRVGLPKFKMETSYRFHEHLLPTLGMKKAFEEMNADFSGITNQPEELYVSSLMHKAFIEVNEKGTEATAATGMTLKEKEIDPSLSIFRVDHPFLFLIQDDQTGSILFMGRVMNPGYPEKALKREKDIKRVEKLIKQGKISSPENIKNVKELENWIEELEEHGVAKEFIREAEEAGKNAFKK